MSLSDTTTDGGALVGRNRRDHHRVLELRGQVVNVRVVIKDFGGHTCELSNRLEDPRNVVQLAGVCRCVSEHDTRMLTCSATALSSLIVAGPVRFSLLMVSFDGDSVARAALIAEGRGRAGTER